MTMRRSLAALTITAAIAATALPSSVAAARRTPSDDSFYTYAGTRPLTALAAGSVLKSRAMSMHLEGLALPVSGTQLLYRTTDTTGRPAITVTTVLNPLLRASARPRLISFQVAYDSLTNRCEPSYALGGGVNPIDLLDASESAQIASYLLSGYTVVTSDYEGEDLAFAAGPGEGRETLDGIRAALHSAAVGLPPRTPVGLVGYSGGAIATEWAAELAPSYAPDLNGSLVGAAQGGVFVDPVHNLSYVNGTTLWSGAIPAALVGMTRALHLDVNAYLSAYGKSVTSYTQDACIMALLGHWPGLTYQKLLRPRFQDITRVPAFVTMLNTLIMGRHGTPTIPMLFGQGTGGTLEGTPGNTPGIGAGDGVMIAADVRTLAREYCTRGVAVQYTEYGGVDHMAGGSVFAAQAASWLAQRFAGVTPATSCATIPPGSSLAPLPKPS